MKSLRERIDGMVREELTWILKAKDDGESMTDQTALVNAVEALFHSELQRIRDEVIGADEPVQKTDDIQEVDVSMNNAEVRNNLRAEQREIIDKELR